MEEGFSINCYHCSYDRGSLSRKCMLQGWKLKGSSYSNLVVAVKYTFEKCQPRCGGLSGGLLSYEKSEASYYNYLRLVEHITDFNGFPTLKLILELRSDAEFEIYNGTRSGGLVMVKKILTMRMLPILLLFLAHYPVSQRFVSR